MWPDREWGCQKCALSWPHDDDMMVFIRVEIFGISRGDLGNEPGSELLVARDATITQERNHYPRSHRDQEQDEQQRLW